MPRSNVFLLYHFFHPDDVISARLFSELGEYLAEQGYDVVAMPCSNGCHDFKTRLPRSEQWNGVTIRRVFRLGLSQHRASGRIVNTAFMLIGWSLRALVTRRRPGEVMIVGTDPMFGVLATIPWRLFRPRARIIHWCHDVYPDAAVADGIVSKRSIIVRALVPVLRIAYRRCDAIIDLGPCMRGLLVEAFGGDNRDDKMGEAKRDVTTLRGTRFDTLVPWSLVEPDDVAEPDDEVRERLFGADSRLGLLYSGNLGRAHQFRGFLELARSVRGLGIDFCFAGRGPCMDQLKSEVGDADANIRFAGFADESELMLRLTAADIHLVSLRDDWTGTVVPSKFFGAIAVGRPVLFAGSADSAIAKWINEYEIGWVLDGSANDRVADQLQSYADSDEEKREMQLRCQRVYRERFCKRVQLEKWGGIVASSE